MATPIKLLARHVYLDPKPFANSELHTRTTLSRRDALRATHGYINATEIAIVSNLITADDTLPRRGLFALNVWTWLNICGSLNSKGLLPINRCVSLLICLTRMTAVRSSIPILSTLTHKYLPTVPSEPAVFQVE